MTACRRNALVFIFFCFGLFGILKHEMWRDELHAWVLARDSLSIPDLLSNMRYEGSPPLWHFLLYVITRFTSQPVFMQISHLLIATLSIWVFLKFSPFSNIQKTLFIFGYFPFYEYLIKSRNYALGVLFIFIFCAVFTGRVRKYTLLFGLLFLLSQSNFMGAIVAVSMGLLLLLEISFGNPRISSPMKKPDVVIGVLIFASMITLLSFQACLPADAFYSWMPGYFTKIDFKRIVSAVRVINKVYMPLTYDPTNSLLVWGPFPKTQFLISVIALIFIIMFFLKKPKVLFLYILSACTMLTFFYIKRGEIRHGGYLYILLIACFWIASHFQSRELKPKFLNRIAVFTEKYRNTFLLLVLSIHFIGGITANIYNWISPYSAAKATALFIKNNHMEKMIMVGDKAAYITPITGYLNNKIYYPEISGFGSYCVWNKKREERKITPDVVIQDAEKLMLQNRQDVLIILTYKLKPEEIPDRLKMLKQFTDTLIRKEVYYLYLLPHDKGSRIKS